MIQQVSIFLVLRFKSMRIKFTQPFVFLLVGIAICVFPCNPTLAFFGSQSENGQNEIVEVANDSDDPGLDRIGHLVRVPLPIDSKVSADVRQTLLRLAESSAIAVRPEDRPYVVLEFDTSGGKTGQGSEFEACQALARFLVNPELNRLQTVAYISASREVAQPDFGVNNESLRSQLAGHAVLVAIAANQLAMEPGTAIGKAGIDDDRVDPLILRAVYQSVANQRLTLPVPVVMSMVENDLQLFRVTTNSRGVVYVGADELATLEDSGEAVETSTISKKGELTLLTQEQLAEFRLVRLAPSSRADLSRLLDLVPHSLDGDPAEGEDWKAVHIKLPPLIDRETTQWVIRSLNQQVSNRQVNLIIFDIESNRGDLDACLRLAQHVVNYDPDNVRTVAFVRDSAQGPVGLVALACQHLIISPDAKLGGQNDDDLGLTIDAAKLESSQAAIIAIAEKKRSQWSMMMAMIDPTLSVSRYRNRITGQVKTLCNEELETVGKIEDWAPLGPIDALQGIDAPMLEQMQIARAIANDMGEVEAFYQLSNSPVSLQPSASDRWVKRLATFLCSPLVAPWLLFGAMFFLSAEMSAPGLGVPGFMASICLVGFFWSQSLGGNAEWFEIVLFVVGVVFVGMEIFVLPGFGIFGIGGLLMVVVSIVLASQSFLLPTTSEQVAQLPYSVLPVLGAGFGMVAGAFALRKIIPNSPYLRRLILDPRPRLETGLEGVGDPEAVVDWSHLIDQKGETITKLYPSGKARIGGRVYDVIANGQMVDKGQAVVVIEARGNRIVVRSDSGE